jgi:hypothetical protein
MSHSSSSDHGQAMPAAGASGIFLPAEVEALHEDDRSAATAIVGLMASIFALGLVGYLLVCYWVGSPETIVGR